jgi:GntR family transcriptional regulator
MLDPNNIVPLYEQAANALREDMRKGVFHSGNRLPTESDLAEKYGISRITIRHAIDKLVKEGLVERKQGKGTFVTQPLMHKDFKRSGVSFTELCAANGKKASAKTILTAIEVPENQHVIKWLNLNQGEEILRIKRLRYADGVPCVIEDNYFPKEFSYLMSVNLNDISLYQYLREERHIDIVTGEMILKIVRADTGIAKLLQVTRNTPLLETWGVVYQGNGEVLHVCNQIGYGENFEFIVR